MGSYKFNINNAKKVFEVTVIGTYSRQDAENFIAEYQKQVARFNPKDYVIDLDCLQMNVSRQETIDQLEACYQLYMESGFQKIIFRIPPNAILQSQLRRVARNTKLQNFEIVQVS